MRIYFWFALSACFMIAASKCALAIKVQEQEHLGDDLHGRAHAWFEGTLHLHTVENVRHGHGQGENFTHWKRADGSKQWHKQLLFTQHMPGMATILPLGDDSTIFLYVDRQDESNRVVYIKRVDGNTVTQLFTLRDGNGVLNPHVDLLDNGQLYVLIPDRTGYIVRRFIVNAQTGEHKRLQDIRMPQRGARIYDRLIRGSQMIVPVAVIHELFLVVINLKDHTHEMYSLDTFTSASNEPPRNMEILTFEDFNRYGILYLRPASFSDRAGRRGAATGLLGEIVIDQVCMDEFKSMSKTVISGFMAEEASTHNYSALQVGPRDVLFANTLVDRIHQRHLTTEYKNYVRGQLTHWHLDDAGEFVKKAERTMEPFWGTKLLMGEGGQVFFFYNHARPGDALMLERLKLVE